MYREDLGFHQRVHGGRVCCRQVEPDGVFGGRVVVVRGFRPPGHNPATFIDDHARPNPAVATRLAVVVFFVALK